MYSEERRSKMPSPSNTSCIEVRRVEGEVGVQAADMVAVEEPLEIQIGLERRGVRTIRSVSVTMRTPGNDEELATGFLFGEGLLNRRSEVAGIERPDAIEGNSTNWVRIHLAAGLRIDFKQLERHFYTTSSCGICGKASLEAVQRMRLSGPSGTSWLRLPVSTVHLLPTRLRRAQQVFADTGGLHAAALFDAEGNLLSVREDVGRHNAVDKLIGAEWLNRRVPLENRILFVSGRASFELVQKAVRAGIPIFAAVGAPSSLAIELAQASGLTLLGFVRDGRFNIYSASHRLERMLENSEATIVA
jgi:FdhD protein